MEKISDDENDFKREESKEDVYNREIEFSNPDDEYAIYRIRSSLF